MLTTRKTNTDADVDWLEEAKYIAENTVEAKVVVDISTVEMIASRELNDLIRLHLDLKQNGRHLVLENAPSQLWEIFKLTRLNRLIEIQQPVGLGS